MSTAASEERAARREVERPAGQPFAELGRLWGAAVGNTPPPPGD